MLNQSKKDGRERAAYIYETDEKLFIGRTHRGERYSVQMKAVNLIPRLLGDIDIIGSMHTHPDVVYDNMLSATDIEMLMDDTIQIAVICYREGDKGYISIYQSDPAEGDKQGFIEENRGETTMETLNNLNESLHTCTRQIWPLN
jgi:proteasome lid subunit RPN8/RPN11